MGGDAAAEVLAAGALDFAATQAVALTLVGNRSALGGVAAGHTVVDAPQAISQQHSLRQALRGARETSMGRALKLLAAGQVDAVVSAGNTAALMALATRLLPRLPGIDRAAIIKQLAGPDGASCWLLDVGANLHCTPERLCQFARMGTAMAQAVGTTPTPRVALLNIGAEHSKGPLAIRRTAALLAADPGIHFVGFLEANRLFAGAADVVVADGFAGNVALKAIEGAAGLAEALLRRELVAAGGAGPLRGALRRLAAAYNPQHHNGASLIGLGGVVVKSHGGADRAGFRQAVACAHRELTGGVGERLGASLAAAGVGGQAGG